MNIVGIYVTFGSYNKKHALCKCIFRFVLTEHGVIFTTYYASIVYMPVDAFYDGWNQTNLNMWYDFKPGFSFSDVDVDSREKNLYLVESHLK